MVLITCSTIRCRRQFPIFKPQKASHARRSPVWLCVAVAVPITSLFAMVHMERMALRTKNWQTGHWTNGLTTSARRSLSMTIEAICAHAGYCTDNLASVFRLKKEPWIDPDGAAVTEIIETIKRCPSGALSYTVDNVEHRDQDREPMVTVTKNGPYAITGGIELLEQSLGEGASTEHYTLCRCGGSKNKPFCDGTHWSIGFEDEKN